MGKTCKLRSSSSSDVCMEAMLDADTIAQAKLSGCRPPHKPRLQTVINSPPQQIWLGVYVKGHLQHRLFSFSGVMPIHISLGHVPPLVWINHLNHSSVSYLVGGLEHFLFFPSYWEFHNPNWRTPSFFRGVGQPPTRYSWAMAAMAPTIEGLAIPTYILAQGLQGIQSCRWRCRCGANCWRLAQFGLL